MVYIDVGVYSFTIHVSLQNTKEDDNYIIHDEYDTVYFCSIAFRKSM